VFCSYGVLSLSRLYGKYEKIGISIEKCTKEILKMEEVIDMYITGRVTYLSTNWIINVTVNV
jgi:hypothetical protein